MSRGELEIGPEEVRELMTNEMPPLLVDVRNAWERELCAIEPSAHIPLDRLASRAGELDRSKKLVIYCHHGVRSLMAARYLQEQGLDAVSLSGGIDLWSQLIDRSIARY